MKNNTEVINIKDKIGKIAVSSDDGLSIYNIIAPLINQVETITLDFCGIEIMTTAFLNAAIGQLYKDFSPEMIKIKLKLVNVNEDDAILFKKVTDRAKEYFKDQESFNQTTNKVFGDE